MNEEQYEKIKKFKEENLPKHIGLLMVDKRTIDEVKLIGAILMSLKGKPSPNLFKTLMDMEIWEE